MQIYPSLYNRLKTQHEMLPEITRNISEYSMQLPPAPGKWPAQGHIAHMARYQGYFISRIDAILEQDTPEFERYNADNDPDFPAWLQKPVDELIETLFADRQVIFKLITDLPEEKLARTGVHKKFGKLSVIKWTEFFVLHESHHLFTVFRLVQDVGLA